MGNLRKTQTITISFLFLLPTLAFAQTITEEQLVGEVTLALKTKNDSLLYNCVPSLIDFQEMVQLQKTYLDIDNNETELPDAETIFKSITEETFRTFQETLDSGQKLGIDWSSIEVIKSELVEEEPNEKELFKKGDIYITYKEGNHRFVVKLVDCIKVNDQWKLMDRIWWYKSL